MQISAMSISTNLSEYSRYEESRNTIDVLVSFTGTVTEGESFIVRVKKVSSLNHPDELCTVMKNTVVVTSQIATENKFSVSFVIGSDDLDKDSINRAISGKYRISVENSIDSSQYWEMSSKITITLLTTKKMKESWLFGVSLKAKEILAPKFQPKIITGLNIDEVSYGIIPGVKVFTLKYLNPNWTLEWSDDDPIVIEPNTNSQYIMTDQSTINYMLVTVDSSLLPTSDKTENILITESMMSDDMIQERIRNSIRTVESKLGFPIEPYIYTTLAATPGYENDHMGQIRQEAYWDRIGRPVDYRVNVNSGNWPGFRFPQQWCLKIHRLVGYFGVNKLVEVDGDWYNNTVDRISSFVTLVPSIRSFVSWTVFANPMLSPFYMRNDLPSFWNYTATFGLPDLEQNDRAVVLELLARVATSAILTEAGRAYQGGVGGESASRDGLSTSLSYNPGGPYATTIQAHEQWIQMEIPRIKSKLGGFLMGVIGA
ncbi:MAG: hypothetical protein EBR94_01280 [Bacteroidetes bacterium]|nr:hypothetical protein [Bacteroidota bacterium]